MANVREPKVLYLEDELLSVACEDVKTLLQRDDAPLRSVLELPKPLLNEHWKAAYQNLISKATISLDEGYDVLLSLHACWYHLQTEEHISALSFCDIRPAHCVITFIDDIYDVFVRLTMPGEVLAPERAKNPLLDPLLKLLFILNWRAFEILLSQRLAIAAQTSQYFLFAVKHHCKTLCSLLFSPTPNVVYLSHHISHPRSLAAIPGSEGHATALKSEIQDFAAELRTHVILFEPTTIDELRWFRVFHKDETHPARVHTESSGRQSKRRSKKTADKQGTEVRLLPFAEDVFLPVLTERWFDPADGGDRLFESPSSTPGAPHFPGTPFFCQAWHDASRTYLDLRKKPNWTKSDIAQIEYLSDIFFPLRNAIYQQINVRDHLLVEQSHSIAVYRPWMDGRLAPGVQGEVLYQKLLSHRSTRKFFVYSRQGDERAWRLAVMERYLTADLANYGTITCRGDLRAAIAALAADGDFWNLLASVPSPGWQHTLGTHILTSLQATYVTRSRTSSVGKDRSVTQHEGIEHLASGLVEAIREYDYFNECGSIDRVEEELRPGRAAKEITRRMREGLGL